jgi:hypothetical protein
VVRAGCLPDKDVEARLVGTPAEQSERDPAIGRLTEHLDDGFERRRRVNRVAVPDVAGSCVHLAAMVGGGIASSGVF